MADDEAGLVGEFRYAAEIELLRALEQAEASGKEDETSKPTFQGPSRALHYLRMAQGEARAAIQVLDIIGTQHGAATGRPQSLLHRGRARTASGRKEGLSSMMGGGGKRVGGGGGGGEAVNPVLVAQFAPKRSEMDADVVLRDAARRREVLKQISGDLEEYFGKIKKSMEESEALEVATRSLRSSLSHRDSVLVASLAFSRRIYPHLDGPALGQCRDPTMVGFTTIPIHFPWTHPPFNLHLHLDPHPTSPHPPTTPPTSPLCLPVRIGGDRSIGLFHRCPRRSILQAKPGPLTPTLTLEATSLLPRATGPLIARIVAATGFGRRDGEGEEVLWEVEVGVDDVGRVDGEWEEAVVGAGKDVWKAACLANVWSKFSPSSSSLSSTSTNSSPLSSSSSSSSSAGGGGGGPMGMGQKKSSGDRGVFIGCATASQVLDAVLDPKGDFLDISVPLLEGGSGEALVWLQLTFHPHSTPISSSSRLTEEGSNVAAAWLSALIEGDIHATRTLHTPLSHALLLYSLHPSPSHAPTTTSLLTPPFRTTHSLTTSSTTTLTTPPPPSSSSSSSSSSSASSSVGVEVIGPTASTLGIPVIDATPTWKKRGEAPIVMPTPALRKWSQPWTPVSALLSTAALAKEMH